MRLIGEAAWDPSQLIWTLEEQGEADLPGLLDAEMKKLSKTPKPPKQ